MEKHPAIASACRRTPTPWPMFRPCSVRFHPAHPAQSQKNKSFLSPQHLSPASPSPPPGTAECYAFGGACCCICCWSLEAYWLSASLFLPSPFFRCSISCLPLTLFEGKTSEPDLYGGLRFYGVTFHSELEYHLLCIEREIAPTAMEIHCQVRSKKKFFLCLKSHNMADPSGQRVLVEV